jgi:uncharacterized membrane protein YtjA (UPF0391 family)
MEVVMLIWTIGFLIIAIVAALLGFPGFASGAAGLAAAMFVLVFLAGTGMTLWQLYEKKRSAPPA